MLTKVRISGTVTLAASCHGLSLEESNVHLYKLPLSAALQGPGSSLRATADVSANRLALF
jgi:hypothetical protein